MQHHETPDQWSPSSMVVKKHQASLNKDLLLHPGIWSDFQLRTRTWQTLLEAARALRRPLTILETGTSRDNDSTWIFHRLIRETGGTVHSFDLDQNLCTFVSEAAARLGCSNEMIVHCRDSVTGIQEFPGTIDVLYLDSQDIDFANPEPSMIHHVRELRAALPKLSQRAIVAFDDTPASEAFVPWWIYTADHHLFRRQPPPGKGAQAIEVLRGCPFAVRCLAHEYQAVFAIDQGQPREDA
jgi:hypothetical protein